MQKIFNQVMIPVSASDLERETLDKAMRFAMQMQCHLHILCVIEPPVKQRITSWFFNGHKSSGEKINQQARELEMYCQSFMTDGLKVKIRVRENSLEASMRDYAADNNIDLVLVCNEIAPRISVNNLNRAGEVAGFINCPVLFATDLPQLADMRIIVLTVDEFLPVNKIRIAIYLASRFNAVIHLLAVERNKLNYGELDYLKRAYAVLKENTSQPFVCQTVSDKNLVKAAVQYARSVHAGLVVSKPVVQQSPFYPLYRFFKTLTNKRREVPVMAVN